MDNNDISMNLHDIDTIFKRIAALFKSLAIFLGFFLITQKSIVVINHNKLMPLHSVDLNSIARFYSLTAII